MASRIKEHLPRVKQKDWKICFISSLFLLFFICCLAAWWTTFGYYQGGSLVHPILITAFGLSIFAQRWLRTVGSLHLIECPGGLVRGFDQNPLRFSPKITENTVPRLAPSFYKMCKCPQHRKELRLTLWWPLGLHNTSLDAKCGV